MMGAWSGLFCSAFFHSSFLDPLNSLQTAAQSRPGVEENGREGKGRKERGEISLPFLPLRFIILSVSFHFPPPTGSRGRDPPSKRKKKEKKRKFNCGSELYRAVFVQDDISSCDTRQACLIDLRMMILVCDYDNYFFLCFSFPSFLPSLRDVPGLVCLAYPSATRLEYRNSTPSIKATLR
ncbi:hypothetical protein B9Z19DRAFT_852077 [Tuber borchii]|uniref:Uncharacterized protein n=1 Tax=Tuber borchii TaxID=42251 RepID=A0A2T6ZUJ3_TUBBO|nr:hypothetical protein B9Z19DRAFT_852077 [Tuber borchii]